MLKLPFFAELEQASRVLVAGAGGGFDIFGGLPLYFALQAAGKTVYLANLSFSQLPLSHGESLATTLLTVTADTPRMDNYFPEKYLAQWFRQQGQETPIYAFGRTGFKPVLEGYQALVEHLQLDTIILVDGGTDSLMRGDEAGLGSPQEDIVSISAVHELDIPRKILACIGFGVDYFHGVCHAHFLEAVSELIRLNGYLGMFSLVEDMPEVKQYRAASEFVHDRMPESPSIVSGSILSALEGQYGDYHATWRTKGSTLWINPLMPVYWCFQVGPVAQRILYRDVIKTTSTFWEVSAVIETFRHTYKPIRQWEDIPV